MALGDIQTSFGDWEYDTIQSFAKGMNTEDPLYGLDPGESQLLYNLMPRGDQLVNVPGLSNENRPLRVGLPMGVRHFVSLNTTQVFCFNTKTIYQRVSSSWKPVKLAGGASTTVSVNAVAGATSLTLTSAVGFAIGDVVGIYLNDATYDDAIISNVVGNVITFAGYPLRADCSATQPVHVAVKLTATDQYGAFSAVNAVAHAKVIFTNGVDAVQAIDMSTLDASALTGLPTTPFLCKCLAYVNSQLFLGNVTQAGTAYPYRVWRSKIGDITSYLTTIGATSGYNDLLDDAEEVTNLMPLGTTLIAYKPKSIYTLEYLGAAERLYDVNRRVPSVGAISYNGVAADIDKHYFFAHNNVYAYAGGTDTLPLFNDVRTTIFNQTTGLQTGRVQLYKDLDQLWVFPGLNSGSILGTRYYWYGLDLKTGAIFVRTGFTFVETGPVNQLAGVPADFYAVQDNSGQLLRVNWTAQDNGVNISWILRTKEFRDAPFRRRVDQIKLYASAVTLTCSVTGVMSSQAPEEALSSFTQQDLSFNKQGVVKALQAVFNGTGEAVIGWCTIKSQRDSES